MNKVIQAYNYNVENGGGDAMKMAATDKNVTIRLIETYLHNNYIMGEPPYVYWNQEAGLLMTAIDVLSPSTSLEHEIDHSYDHANYPEEHNKRMTTPVKGY